MSSSGEVAIVPGDDRSSAVGEKEASRERLPMLRSGVERASLQGSVSYLLVHLHLMHSCRHEY